MPDANEVKLFYNNMPYIYYLVYLQYQIKEVWRKLFMFI